MYKVFINDKEIRFLKPGLNTPPEGKELDMSMPPEQMVSTVKAYPDISNRIFYQIDEYPNHRFEKFISSFTSIKAAGGIVRRGNTDGPLLLIYRLGKWDLPKGKIDTGESHEQAALREVSEECGISNLKIIRRLGNTFHMYELKGRWVVKTTFWYLMVTDENQQLIPQLEEGITEVKWVEEKDIYFLLPFAYTSIADLLLTEILNR